MPLIKLNLKKKDEKRPNYNRFGQTVNGVMCDLKINVGINSQLLAQQILAQYL